MHPVISEIQANILIQDRHREAAAWRAARAAREARRRGRHVALRSGTTVPSRSRWSRAVWFHQAPEDAALPR